MRGFNSYLKQRQERREELSSALKTIGENQTVLGETSADALRKIALSKYAAEGIGDMVNRHLGPEAISRHLGPRSRR